MSNKILIIDDDPTLLRFLSDYLTNQHFITFTASKGSDGLRLAYQEHPDLVILDLMMPEMDGWEVCSRLREMCDVPIILLTAKSSEADKLRGFRIGVDDYVTKPFSFAELTARLQAILARATNRQTPEREVLALRDIVVDTDRREVRRDDEVISLSPTEYRLLEYMVRHQGSAMSDEQLLEEVWGANRDEDTAALRRYIFLLRQKIEEDPSNPTMLLTVRGFGYRVTGKLRPPRDPNPPDSRL